jgi:hypothetical protein
METMAEKKRLINTAGSFLLAKVFAGGFIALRGD